jgi:hypothetical protein
MKIDQIAYYCGTKEAEQVVKKMLGLESAEWIKDRVTANSTVWGHGPFENVANLQFNYDLGIELEIIRYVEGTHWHGASANKEDNPFISHVGIHLEDNEDFPPMIGCELAQETFTKSHTSEYLTTGAGAGRLYHYKIFSIGRGNYLKYIKRRRENEVGFKA